MLAILGFLGYLYQETNSFILPLKVILFSYLQLFPTIRKLLINYDVIEMVEDIIIDISIF